MLFSFNSLLSKWLHFQKLQMFGQRSVRPAHNTQAPGEGRGGRGGSKALNYFRDATIVNSCKLFLSGKWAGFYFAEHRAISTAFFQYEGMIRRPSSSSFCCSIMWDMSGHSWAKTSSSANCSWTCLSLSSPDTQLESRWPNVSLKGRRTGECPCETLRSSFATSHTSLSCLDSSFYRALQRRPC